MSFNRLNNDTCTYAYKLKQSIGPGEYGISEPNIECNTCFQANPEFRLSNNKRRSTGVSICESEPLIDIDSELKNITRKASDCPLKQYRGQKACRKTKDFPDCDNAKTITEHTRLSNPPCTLRCSGWNRWEWLCRNPQDKALVPFDYQISGRTLAKDNHRPCIPTPLNQYDVYPSPNEEMPQRVVKNCHDDVDNYYSTQWRSCKTYSGYM